MRADRGRFWFSGAVVSLLLAAGCAGPVYDTQIEEAEALSRAGSDDAAAAIERATEVTPDAAPAWRRIAACWFDLARSRTDQEERSQALSRASLALASASETASATDQVMLQRDLAALAMDCGDDYGAIQHLRRYRSFRADDVPASVALARLLLDRGRSEEARNILEPLRAELDVDGVGVLGVAYFLTDELGEAESAFRRAVTLTVEEETRAKYAYDLGLVLNAQGRTDEARESFEHALELDDEHEGAERELARGRVHEWAEPVPHASPEARSRRAPAPEAWTPTTPEPDAPVEPPAVEVLTARTTGPAVDGVAAVSTASAPDDLLRRAHASMQSGDAAGALALLTEAIELAPDFAEAYLERGATHRALRQFDQAIADCTSAIHLSPRHAPAYYGRGLALQAHGDLSAAIADHTSAIELDPGFAAAFNSRGVAQQELEFLSSAITDFTRAIELAPELREAYLNRAAARLSVGDPEAAVADYSRAISLRPDDGRAHCGRGAARHAQGDLEGAVADVRHGLELLPQDDPRRGGLEELLGGYVAEQRPTPPEEPAPPEGE